MIKQKKVLAIIPARGGSKGLPGKNIRPLNGIPLVAWPIKTALSSRYVDRVIVTTDAPEIAKVALAYGAEVPFMRPAEFARDTSPSSEAVIHAIKFCAETDGPYDYFVLLEPTSPLTEAADVDEALETLVAGEGLSIVGASKVEASHPVYCATIGDDNFLRPYNRESFAKPIRRQDVDDVYFFEGSLYISDTKKYLETETFYHERTLPYIVPAWKSLEVDTLLDFLKIETILKNKELLI
ncbi:N-acylneuraminate cytidylyltransferase [Legionella donaldsonii]|uniref:N-acylneuraminate cytidylyltransferase n=1 Tax=Legionella donaldsonii TaxID=45060 RepID=A0A378J2I9_9GAMM|nr:acylneuraminate cytidylyltransferase family protein [Legionella donaldsonii]STX41616.1 N-acylneuraminate cytidylyltransferase [Legionella donaldsonii]